MAGTILEAPTLDARTFIPAHMEFIPVPSLPEISLYTAHAASGLRRLTGRGDEVLPAAPPYWAYSWAGGIALARYFLDRPETVTGRRVLDLGAGSGIVAIAAAKAGASEVTAAEIDPHGLAAITLNAAANGVAITAIGEDLTGGPAPEVNLVAVGDLFYAPDLAGRVTAFLDRCIVTGIEALIGDPYRAHLPQERLRLVAEYDVPDFGTGKHAATRSGVFILQPALDRQDHRPLHDCILHGPEPIV
jgi:predicted nicotinamide N-methyase